MRDSLDGAKTRSALRVSARVSLQVLLVLALTWVLLWLLGRLWPAIWPVVVALLITTLTWPLTRFLRQKGWPSALAASAVTLVFLVVAIGVVLLIVLPVVSQSGALADGVADGVEKLREWVSGPPFNISDEQVASVLDDGVTRVRESIGSIVNAVLTGVGTVTSGLVTAILAVFLMFFFLKDGPRFLPWLTRQLPGRLAEDVPVVAERCWVTLGSFVRSQAFVGLLDAIFIGIGLWIVGVPLVLPLAVLTFVSAFVPIVGALFAGAVAVLIALVFNGPGDALIVLAIIIAVQQIEGNVLQPMVQSRSLGLHAAVVLLAVTLGGSMAGIAGSLLAVPLAAMVAVIWDHIRTQLGAAPQRPDAEVPAEESGEQVST